MSFVAHTFVSL